jgi:hypothetical protein
MKLRNEYFARAAPVRQATPLRACDVDPLILFTSHTSTPLHTTTSINIAASSRSLKLYCTYEDLSLLKFRIAKAKWVPLYHVSTSTMNNDDVLATKLHTLFTIYLYAFRLHTAMLTKSVYLDAADAERCVSLCRSSDRRERYNFVEELGTNHGTVH